MTQAETLEAHRRLREDLWRSSWAYYVVELADAFVQDDDPHQLLFDLLLETLGRLDRGADPLLVVRYYEVHLLSLAGYQPQLFRCVQCGELLQPEINFLSLARGGCLCPQHGANHPETLALLLPVLKVLRFLQSRGWEEVAALQITPATMSQVEAVLKRYVVYHLERTVRSATFLDRLRATWRKLSSQRQRVKSGKLRGRCDGDRGSRNESRDYCVVGRSGEATQKSQQRPQAH